MNPMSNKPKITRDDIINGYVTRHFCKYTSTGVITEIDAKQYYKIRKDPYYQSIKLKWEITGVADDVVAKDGNILRGTRHRNEVVLDFYEKKMPGLKDIIRNPLEYFNGT